MSYSQKIKTLLQKMKKIKNYNNSQKNSNISRNYVIENNNIPLIDEEICINNMKRYPIKKYKNRYQTSNEKKHNDLKNNHMHLYENKDYKNNKKYKFNNNFIIETNYENNNLYKNRSNIISLSNKNNTNNIITDEKKLLFNKLIHINTDNSNNNIINIYTSNHKTRNLSNSEDEIHYNQNILSNNAIYLSGANKNKTKLSSYILKNKNNELKIYTNNTSPLNFSSFYSKKNFSSKLSKNIDITNVNNSYKNISSRIVKRQPIKSLSELFNEERNNKITNNLNCNNTNTNCKYLKKKLLMDDKNYKIIYDNEDKKNKFKRNCNSTSNLRERDNHSGGKIILALDENSSRRKSRKIKNKNYYIIKIQSLWRGYMLRKLIKITKELFLLFIPFINKIKKGFNNHKKKYFLTFKKNINKYFIKYSNNKNISYNNNNNNKIKKKTVLYSKNDNNIKKGKFMKKYITTAPLLNKDINLKKKINVREKKYEPKINDIRKIKIDNIFYQKKKLSFNKYEGDNNKILLNDNKRNISNFNLKKYNYNLPNKRLIKRTSYKRFYNVSPDYRNIELNINNSCKNSIYEQRNNLNNYSSSISIFFQTQFPKINSLKNLVYVNKNKKPKNSIKSDIFEKIKIKIFNNFYLTLYKCIKKSILRFYWNKLLYKLKQKQNNAITLYNLKKRNILKSIIINITNKIKKHYFRKYRENILVEKIKKKLFYLTDYSRTKSNIFHLNNKNNVNRSQKLKDIFLKYKQKSIIYHYFSNWKMKIYYNFIQIDFPLSSTRSKYSKQNINYINKIINSDIDEFKESNKKQQQKLIYKKNSSNYFRKNESSPLNKYITQSQSYANDFFSPYDNNDNNHFTKYNKKFLTNQNSLINNRNQKSNYFYSKKIFPKNKLRRIIDNINIKKEKYKFFNLWKTKLNNKRKYIKVNNRFSFLKNKFLKYFLVALKFFLQKEKGKISNKNSKGLALFIWYRKAFIMLKKNSKNSFLYMK